MNICVLDAKTLGSDIDLAPFGKLGKVSVYDLTSKEEVEDRIKDVEVIITNKVVLNEESLKNACNVKIIALTATGYNNVDLEYAKSRGIAVTNVAGYSTKSVAQHTLALLLNILEQLSFYDEYVKSRAYEESDTFAYIGKPFYEIDGKRWGIIGMGAIGQEVAKIATVMGAEVVYYSTSGSNNDQPYKQVEFKELLETCDILSIHAPLNEKTSNLLTYNELGQMKKEAVLVNVGRGGIVNEVDLARALNENKIRGAALDVLTQEPIAKDSPLYTIKDSGKWLVTPHIAWASVEARTRVVEEVCENIRAFYRGEKRNRIV